MRKSYQRKVELTTGNKRKKFDVAKKLPIARITQQNKKGTKDLKNDAVKHEE